VLVEKMKKRKLKPRLPKRKRRKKKAVKMVNTGTKELNHSYPRTG
jgi:hypothetical protein